MYERGRSPIRLFLIATREELLRQSDYNIGQPQITTFYY